MDPSRTKAADIDAYIADFPAATQTALQEIRRLIRSIAPDAVETISYAIPTFNLDGRHLVHFAGYANHVGLYPTPSGMETFDSELAHYQRGKGSVRFPLDEPLPLGLIQRIVEYRVEEERARRPK